ncbi:Peroxiredoxin-6 [Amphibalanus amphitrite]|uniref:1-Cys peroxiredoxin n=2 Tax=Amphibalanus amphitrite TaxID=1232801 RepID=A0A6A4W8B3_AMPAM|nr:peroxiredoxin-6-like isoform X1 [Amphibalanus amphitrite]KAF0303997.1 Peroxiredoxin-6 [Amphibalanus amphitrite]
MCNNQANMVLLGEVFPNFEAETTEGPIKFHDWLGGSWGILFSHPADFTPVCTTELGAAAQLAPEFAKRGVKMIAVSCDPVQSHKDWIKDIEAYNHLAGAFPYPIIADEERRLAVQLGMLDPDERTAEGLCLTARAVFVVGPDNRLKLSILYPATTGRNFHEILRAIDSLQLTAQKKVATPVNWKAGDKCMVLPSISEDDAKKLFPAGVEVHEVPSGKKYIRTTPQPQ